METTFSGDGHHHDPPPLIKILKLVPGALFLPRFFALDHFFELLNYFSSWFSATGFS